MENDFLTNNTDEGKPLKINELNIEALAKWLCDHNIRSTQGKLIQPLSKSHLEIINDPARYKVVAAGRRYGKTLLTSLIALAVLFKMNRRVWVVAPDYSLCEKVFRELYNILVNQLKIIEPGKQGRARSQKGDYFLETPWHSILEGKSMDRADSLAGDAVDLVIVDEAALQSNIEDIWTQMINPTLIDKEGSAIFISTPRGKNSYYKLYLMGQLGLKQRQNSKFIELNEDTGLTNDVRDWAAFQRTSYDNPLLASTPEKSKEEIDAAYRRAMMSGKILKFNQEYLADFESVADIVFPGFIEEKDEENPYPNVIDYDWHPDEGPIYSASDHNYAKPAATIFAQVNNFNDVVIFDECFTPHTTSFMQAQQILDKESELTKKAWQMWQREKKPLLSRYDIKVSGIIADISGSQNQLSGRSAWDDFETVLGRRPVGIKQDRETGCNMIRQWLQFPQFDQKGRAILDEKGNPKTLPKLFITRNCINTIYAISTATFKKGKAGDLKEDYEATSQGYEGLIDALRYLLVYIFHDRGDFINIVGGV